MTVGDSSDEAVGDSDNEAFSLHDQALALLAEGADEEALEIGRRLETMQYSGAFLVQAQALGRLGKQEEAVTVLRRGVDAVPGVWSLWELLGTTLSDLDRLDEAHEALARALDCTEVDPSSVQFNVALIFQRAGDHDAALTRLELVTDPDLSVRRRLAQLTSLNALGRHDEARRLGTSLLDELLTEGRPGVISRDLARTHAQIARSIWEGAHDADEAMRHAWASAHLDTTLPSALELIRTIRDRRSSRARYMTLVVQGRWCEPVDEKGDLPGFLKSCGVVADDEGEALEMVRELLPPPVQASLEIDEVKVLEDAPDVPRGVVWSSGYAFFSAEDGDEGDEG